ncbi:DUF1365 domain-containing protein [Methylocapsa sp. S129]|uniref:DUF1365 domain-containing protein n=1 Tax=Methylocapsa sp. S129 TaxID=1641869 RepID=UPI00131A6E9C|nr:DUF1365 family protein [Methylocapsa sp. S129]
MNALKSGLYVGQVTHRRLRPRKHALRYRTFALLLDLDELPELVGRLRLLSRNSFNLFSFFDCDYGSGSKSLREQVEGHARQAELDLDGGPIRLLTMPRILGYAFNPISLYFCHSRGGELRAILYEVNNTFGQRHSYFIPVEEGEVGPISQFCAKQFYVSPFMAMDMTYEFTVTPPGEKVSIAIVERDRQGVVLTATQAQDRLELTDAALGKVFFSHPLLTLKVIVGIHLEALVLWVKGMRLQVRPPPPDQPVTHVVRRVHK